MQCPVIIPDSTWWSLISHCEEICSSET
jgi:hypothetical protein